MSDKVTLDAFAFSQRNASDWVNPELRNLAIAAGASALIVVWRGNEPTAVTIGGQAMSLLDGSGSYYVYYLERPPTGASVELSVTATAAENQIWSFSVFDSGGPPTAFTIETNFDGPNHSKSCVTKDGRSLVFDVIRKNSGGFGVPTAGAGQTTLQAEGSGVVGSSSEAAPDPSFGATVEVTWTTVAGEFTHLAFCLNAFDEGVPAGMTPVVMR